MMEQFLGWADPLEQEITTHSLFFHGQRSLGSQRVEHDLHHTHTPTHTHTHTELLLWIQMILLPQSLNLLTSFICGLLLLLFWPCHTACGILVPGIEHRPLAMKLPSSNCWTARDFPMYVTDLITLYLLLPVSFSFHSFHFSKYSLSFLFVCLERSLQQFL